MTTAIADYSPTEGALADLRQRFKGVVFDVATTKGMDEAKKARAELRTLRVDLEKKRVDIKAPALERCRVIDSEAKRITSELVELEDPIDAQIKAEEVRKEADRAAKLEAERTRIAAIRARIDQIKRNATAAITLDAEGVRALIGPLLDASIDDAFLATFEELAVDAKATLEATMDFLVELRDKKAAAEAESERIKAERAELDRERREQDEREATARRQREAEETATREARAAEDRRLAEQRAEIERQQTALRQQQEAQAAEQRRIDAERQAQERERERQDAAGRDEAARVERERLAEEQRQRDEEARVAARRERVKAAKCSNPVAALYAIAAIVADAATDDVLARYEIGVVCEANLPEKVKAPRVRKAAATVEASP